MQLFFVLGLLTDETGLKTFYSQNFFTAHSGGNEMWAMCMWLREIGPRNAAAIRNLFVEYGHISRYCMFDNEMEFLSCRHRLHGPQLKLHVRRAEGLDASSEKRLAWYQVSYGKLGKGQKVGEEEGDWFVLG